MGTKMTLTNEHGYYSISIKNDELCINDIFDELVIPLLSAAGYSTEIINEYLGVSD